MPTLKKMIFQSEDPAELSEAVSSKNCRIMFDAPASGNFQKSIEISTVRELFIWHSSSPTGYHTQHDVMGEGWIQLHYVENGTLQLTNGGHATITSSTKAYFVPPFATNDVVASPGSRRMVIGIPRSRFASLIAADTDDPDREILSFERCSNLTDNGTLTLHKMACVLLGAGSSEHPFENAPLAAALLKEALITSFLRLWPRKLPRPLTSAAYPKNVKRAVEWLHAHAGERIGGEDIARAAGASLRGLEIAFKEHLGVSPFAFLQKIRLQRAHHDLVHGAPETTVGEIAKRWGFSHMGHFAGRYRTVYGELPSETRKNML